MRDHGEDALRAAPGAGVGRAAPPAAMSVPGAAGEKRTEKD